MNIFVNIKNIILYKLLQFLIYIIIIILNKNSRLKKVLIINNKILRFIKTINLIKIIIIKFKIRYKNTIIILDKIYFFFFFIKVTYIK